MSVLLIAAGCIVLLAWGYFFYARKFEKLGLIPG